MLSVVILSVVLLSVVMLNVIMLSVVMLNVIMLSVVMPNVIMLTVVMLSVIMLSVVMVKVVTPFLLHVNQAYKYGRFGNRLNLFSNKTKQTFCLSLILFSKIIPLSMCAAILNEIK
jgi:hypothetical protein